MWSFLHFRNGSASLKVPITFSLYTLLPFVLSQSYLLKLAFRFTHGRHTLSYFHQVQKYHVKLPTACWLHCIAVTPVIQNLRSYTLTYLKPSVAQTVQYILLVSGKLSVNPKSWSACLIGKYHITAQPMRQAADEHCGCIGTWLHLSCNSTAQPIRQAIDQHCGCIGAWLHLSCNSTAQPIRQATDQHRRGCTEHDFIFFSDWTLSYRSLIHLSHSIFLSLAILSCQITPYTTLTTLNFPLHSQIHCFIIKFHLHTTFFRFPLISLFFLASLLTPLAAKMHQKSLLTRATDG